MSRKLLVAGIAAVASTAVFCTGIICYATARTAARAAEQRQEANKREEESVRLMAKEEPASLSGETEGTKAEQGEKTAASETEPGETEKAGSPAGEETRERESQTDPEAHGTDKAALPLTVESALTMYRYDQMVQDIEILQAKYPELITVDSLTDTPDGRKIWHLIIGSPEAEEHFLVTGSIHAREYMSTQLVMKQTVKFLENKDSYVEALKNKAIHVVPMINPDGVSISQLGMSGCLLEETKAMVQEISRLDGAGDMAEYLRRWKSNAQGIDLNRNFDALWENYNDGPAHPSADHYKGTSVACAPETAAMVALTEKYPFVRTISYHTQGSVIYWYFGQTGQLKTDTETFANEVSRVTGYPTDANYANLDPAGYKDWAIAKKGIPSLTIEVGRETSPVPAGQFDTVWNENQGVWQVLLGL